MRLENRAEKQVFFDLGDNVGGRLWYPDYPQGAKLYFTRRGTTGTKLCSYVRPSW